MTAIYIAIGKKCGYLDYVRAQNPPTFPVTLKFRKTNNSGAKQPSHRSSSSSDNVLGSLLGFMAHEDRCEVTSPVASEPIYVVPIYWKTLCRLLPDVDSVVYVDTDILFFRPVEELWFMLHNFNKSQVIGIPPEDPHRTGWYTHVAKHPSYPPTGVNTGVLVMNLTRLRAIDFPSKIVDLYKIWYSKIKWGEQDVVNIWLHYNPEKLYLISCEWNFRNDHCNGGNACKGAEKNGIGILHGNGQQYLIPGKRPELMAINDAFLKYLSSENPKADIAEAVKRNLANVRRVTDCLKALRYIFRDLTLP
ncbi:hypothetical protein FSP39_019836 [Pinctada imbricata]|uniref:UDP-D-xylose:beta-D-glucoside alpha-1,3-D-xylosyltransferase n=1 Tax=Pinctada imbricata TaxID=66713 RepID=A0AA88YA39_PINIB|nr:hypothetical protein FSP39_019836 [Pinctada imbricata]